MSKVIVPGLIGILLIILGSVNLQTLFFAPHFSAMTVFYWGVYNPDLMPKWFVFALGIFQDMLYGMPIGITSLLLLLLWWIVVPQRKNLTGEPFFMIWIVFTIAIIIFVLLGWLFYSLYFGQMFYSASIIIQLAVSITIYPCIHTIFNTAHKK